MKRFTKQFALCLDNAGNEASIVVGKVYPIVPDPRAAKDALVRVIDESGEIISSHAINSLSWTFQIVFAESSLLSKELVNRHPLRSMGAPKSPGASSRVNMNGYRSCRVKRAE